MSGFGFREMILSGWPVLSILLVMSVVSVTVIWDRVAVFRRARLDARAFFANVIRMLTEQGAEQAYDYAGQFAKPAALIARRILAQPGGREARERAAQNALQTQVNELERYVAVLGTIGSTAPFIGLFGTVMGIIKAFQDIALNAGGGPEVVSVGIAEALITTAFGLLVAIPAVIGYNYCVRQIQRLAQDIDVAAFDLLEKLTGEAE